MEGVNGYDCGPLDVLDNFFFYQYVLDNFNKRALFLLIIDCSLL